MSSSSGFFGWFSGSNTVDPPNSNETTTPPSVSASSDPPQPSSTPESTPPVSPTVTPQPPAQPSPSSQPRQSSQPPAPSSSRRRSRNLNLDSEPNLPPSLSHISIDADSDEAFYSQFTTDQLIQLRSTGQDLPVSIMRRLLEEIGEDPNALVVDDVESIKTTEEEISKGIDRKITAAGLVRPDFRRKMMASPEAQESELEALREELDSDEREERERTFELDKSFDEVRVTLQAKLKNEDPDEALEKLQKRYDKAKQKRQQEYLDKKRRESPDYRPEFDNMPSLPERKRAAAAAKRRYNNDDDDDDADWEDSDNDDDDKHRPSRGKGSSTDYYYDENTFSWRHRETDMHEVNQHPYEYMIAPATTRTNSQELSDDFLTLDQRTVNRKQHANELREALQHRQQQEKNSKQYESRTGPTKNQRFGVRQYNAPQSTTLSVPLRTLSVAALAAQANISNGSTKRLAPIDKARQQFDLSLLEDDDDDDNDNYDDDDDDDSDDNDEEGNKHSALKQIYSMLPASTVTNIENRSQARQSSFSQSQFSSIRDFERDIKYTQNQEKKLHAKLENGIDYNTTRDDDDSNDIDPDNDDDNDPFGLVRVEKKNRSFPVTNPMAAKALHPPPEVLTKQLEAMSKYQSDDQLRSPVVGDNDPRPYNDFVVDDDDDDDDDNDDKIDNRSPEDINAEMLPDNFYSDDDFELVKNDEGKDIGYRLTSQGFAKTLKYYAEHRLKPDLEEMAREREANTKLIAAAMTELTTNVMNLRRNQKSSLRSALTDNIKSTQELRQEVTNALLKQTFQLNEILGHSQAITIKHMVNDSRLEWIEQRKKELLATSSQRPGASNFKTLDVINTQAHFEAVSRPDSDFLKNANLDQIHAEFDHSQPVPTMFRRYFSSPEQQDTITKQKEYLHKNTTLEEEKQKESETKNASYLDSFLRTISPTYSAEVSSSSSSTTTTPTTPPVKTFQTIPTAWIYNLAISPNSSLHDRIYAAIYTNPEVYYHLGFNTLDCYQWILRYIATNKIPDNQINSGVIHEYCSKYLDWVTTSHRGLSPRHVRLGFGPYFLQRIAAEFPAQIPRYSQQFGSSAWVYPQDDVVAWKPVLLPHIIQQLAADPLQLNDVDAYQRLILSPENIGYVMTYYAPIPRMGNSRGSIPLPPPGFQSPVSQFDILFDRPAQRTEKEELLAAQREALHANPRARISPYLAYNPRRSPCNEQYYRFAIWGAVPLDENGDISAEVMHQPHPEEIYAAMESSGEDIGFEAYHPETGKLIQDPANLPGAGSLGGFSQQEFKEMFGNRNPNDIPTDELTSAVNLYVQEKVSQAELDQPTAKYLPKLPPEIAIEQARQELINAPPSGFDYGQRLRQLRDLSRYEELYGDIDDNEDDDSDYEPDRIDRSLDLILANSKSPDDRDGGKSKKHNAGSNQNAGAAINAGMDDYKKRFPHKNNGDDADDDEEVQISDRVRSEMLVDRLRQNLHDLEQQLADDQVRQSLSRSRHSRVNAIPQTSGSIRRHQNYRDDDEYSDDVDTSMYDGPISRSVQQHQAGWTDNEQRLARASNRFLSIRKDAIREKQKRDGEYDEYADQLEEKLLQEKKSNIFNARQLLREAEEALEDERRSNFQETAKIKRREEKIARLFATNFDGSPKTPDQAPDSQQQQQQQQQQPQQRNAMNDSSSDDDDSNPVFKFNSQRNNPTSLNSSTPSQKYNARVADLNSKNEQLEKLMARVARDNGFDHDFTLPASASPHDPHTPLSKLNFAEFFSKLEQAQTNAHLPINNNNNNNKDPGAKTKATTPTRNQQFENVMKNPKLPSPPNNNPLADPKFVSFLQSAAQNLEQGQFTSDKARQGLGALARGMSKIAPLTDSEPDEPRYMSKVRQQTDKLSKSRRIQHWIDDDDSAPVAPPPQRRSMSTSNKYYFKSAESDNDYSDDYFKIR